MELYTMAQRVVLLSAVIFPYAVATPKHGNGNSVELYEDGSTIEIGPDGDLFYGMQTVRELIRKGYKIESYEE